MVALVLVAASVGLDNFGAATTIGMTGVDRRLRIRVAVIFGVFEASMPLIGIVLGHSVSHDLGSATQPVGGTLLALVGVYTVLEETIGRKEDAPRPEPGLKRLLLIGAALSIDNLVIGFALGTFHVNLLVAAIVIAAVSVAFSLLGLEIGQRLGGRLGQRSGLVGGGVLIAVGIAIETGLLVRALNPEGRQ